MAYVSFIEDQDFLDVVGNLFDSYVQAYNNSTLNQFYDNKIDVIKMMFDVGITGITPNNWVLNEVNRQIDKTINNAIGTFHEQLLGSIAGYENKPHSGWDIRALDNTLFADTKNKFNTMNSSSSESLYQKLQSLAEEYPQSTCYWVAILAKNSYDEPWVANFGQGQRIYAHPRVRKISGDKFYALLSGVDNALYQIYKAIPSVLSDYINSLEDRAPSCNSNALKELEANAHIYERGIIDQIAAENYPYYSGFEDL